MRLLFFLQLFLWLSLSPTHAQKLATDPLEPIRDRMQEGVKKGEIASVSFGVAKAGQTLYLESFGWADKKGQKRANGKTIYPLGSLSKSITATGLMHLIQQGRIGLDDEANKFLPGQGLRSYVGDPAAVKVWHILNMAAGIPHGWATQSLALGYPKTEQEKISFLQKTGLVTFPPGEVSHYSNYSYGIAELLIEQASQQSLEEFMSDAIFDPLGMEQSLVRYEASRAAEMAQLYDPAGQIIAPYHFLPFGGAGYWGSVTDLLAYGNFHLQLPSAQFPKVLDKKHLDLMHNFNEGPMPYFGFGWLNTGHSLISNGNINGANSNITLIPDEQMVIVCLINSTSPSSLADQFADQIMNALLPNLEKELDMAYFMANYQTPYEPKPGLIGEWEGMAHIQDGTTPVHLTFAADGEIWCKIGTQASARLSDVTLLPSGKLEAVGEGILAVPEFTATDPVNIAIALQWEGDQLYGHMAPRFSTSKGNRCYGAFVSFQKKE